MAGILTMKRVALHIAVLITMAAVPATVSAGTLTNGSYVGAPGERNLIKVVYEPSTGTYDFTDGRGVIDGDGAGGCTVNPEGFKGSCPPSAIPGPITVHGGDNDDVISMGPGGFLPEIGLPGAPFPNTANQIRMNSVITGGAGWDLIAGGLGVDQIDAGTGPDIILTLEDRFPGAFPGPPPELQASDSIVCGTGGETEPIQSGSGPPLDSVIIGSSDEVQIDCEDITQLFPCPIGRGDCIGEASVVATVPASKSAAQAAGKRNKRGKGKSRKRKLTIARDSFELFEGATMEVHTEINQRLARKALRGRDSVPATFEIRLGKPGKSRFAATAKRKSRKRPKLKLFQRSSFLLAK